MEQDIAVWIAMPWGVIHQDGAGRIRTIRLQAEVYAVAEEIAGEHLPGADVRRRSAVAPGLIPCALRIYCELIGRGIRPGPSGC